MHPSRVCMCSGSTSGQRDLRGHVLAPSISQALGVSLMSAQTLAEPGLELECCDTGDMERTGLL